LVLRGAQSDILRPAVAAAMTERGPRARLVEFAGVGHNPALMAAEQIAAVEEFLIGGRRARPIRRKHWATKGASDIQITPP
jgi:pimeloyl-ACP methyl ester carboxylesterase